jgi:DNA-binding FadR family transcriptional regulator
MDLAEMDPMAEVPDEIEADGTTLNYDGAFHARIAQAAGNTVLADTIDGLFKRMSAYRSLRMRVLHTQWSPSGEFLLATKREHIAIVRAIKRGNPEAAQTAMRKHLDAARRRDIDPVSDDESAATAALGSLPVQ